MYERTLNLNDYALLEHPKANAKLQAWLRFNGIDPHRVVQNSLMTVRNNYAEIVCFDGTKDYNHGFSDKTVDLAHIHTPMEDFDI